MMADPITELERARIRYLSANLRGEITDKECGQRLAMIDRTIKRLELKAERLVKARESSRSWKRQARFVKRSMELSDGL
jgi:hypothetical protein